MAGFLPGQIFKGSLASVFRACQKVFEKGPEEDSFTQTYLSCPLTISYRYPLCFILLTVNKQCHVCDLPWGVYC